MIKVSIYWTLVYKQDTLKTIKVSIIIKNQIVKIWHTF